MKTIQKAGCVAVIVTLAAVLTACGGAPEGETAAPASQPGVPVETVALSRSAFTEYGIYYGKLAPLTEAVLTVSGGGTVEAISAYEGELVEKGDSLASVDLAAAESAYGVAELNERISRETLQRQRELLERGNASKLAVDQAELAHLSARSELIRARRLLEGARCETPIDGIVISRHIELYDELVPGSKSFTVAETRRMRIEIGIPESDIAGVAPGNRAEVTFDGFPGEIWEGRLDRLSREVSPATLTFRAEIVIDTPDRRLPPGLTARVKLTRRTLPDAAVLPSQAVLNDLRGSYLMVVDNGKARRVDVVVGPTDESRTVVIGGVTGDEEIIIAGNHLVSEGAPVAVNTREGSES